MGVFQYFFRFNLLNMEHENKDSKHDIDM